MYFILFLFFSFFSGAIIIALGLVILILIVLRRKRREYRNIENEDSVRMNDIIDPLRNDPIYHPPNTQPTDTASPPPLYATIQPYRRIIHPLEYVSLNEEQETTL